MRELNLPGYALDCAYGGASYRGLVINQALPGRARMKKGFY